VRDGVDGLHFRVRDPSSLADVIRRAVTTPGLWDELRGGIRPVHPMAGHVARITDAYERLLGQRPGERAA
jgi:hypothetical protein